ncbi:NADH-quinone oxidoreductase subunit NuoF [Proteiniclasticum sp. BAD-10]|uniref:NADH-quinone oxidoreductase subunit NuoF n=1 Tax=Proteiniclasticum sediminis TaxID=2804028 RepID=A0A941CN00_9CLOT|nr:NADH-quinone oxidoreductase subunit NuoF [Proteiniclasticum sediminis]MBR0575550.1 NADH-quinone oxidoreductase subunit NuoF [Proteiniclasticum sediminis]
MKTAMTPETLKSLREELFEMRRLRETGSGKSATVEILVGLATCGIAAGGQAVYDKLTELLETEHLPNIRLVKVGCIGSCYCEPTVQVNLPGKAPVYYGYVDPESAERILREHVLQGQPVQDKIINMSFNRTDPPGAKRRQLRIALKNCGNLDPENIREYIAFDGYAALSRVLTGMSPEEVISTVKDSGLRGRGGGGFPTGLKWQATREQVSPEKYMICNADEGDPGAYMDRSLLEGDPHSVLEGLAIGGYATGASHGIIYIRAEYPLAIARLNTAIDQAREWNLLGKNILQTGFDFDVELRLGAGAFVCGEETALIHSVEGKRGEPTKKPPYPSEEGYRKKPTTVNNVETLANIPQIILRGPGWFSSIGTAQSKGTKVFALVGKINHVGLVEVPMGTTLREIIYDIGGGIPDGKDFKAVQTGGPSGGVISKEYLDTSIDYESLRALGTMMGSGGMIVMDETNCMVDIAKFYLQFTMDESCGKCTPCRIGTKRLHELLDSITKGKAAPDVLQKMERLGNNIRFSALCGLGQTAPNPVLSTMRYFPEEYRLHVEEHTCPTGVCKGLFRYSVIPEKCVGCTACRRVCPVGCISGHPKQVHFIDVNLCISCGACFDACKFNAIRKA